MNKIKSLKSPELESMMINGTSPNWIKPGHDDMVIDEDGNERRVYTEDNDGIEDYNYDRAQWRSRRTFFVGALPRAVSIIYSSISEPIMDKMRIEANFQETYNKNDVIGLVNMAQFASMGEGSSTVYQNMAQLMGLKIKDNNFFEFVKLFQQYRRRANSEMDKAALVETFFDTIFIMGLKNYQPLEKELDTIFGSKTWPTADESIIKFSTMITVKGTMSLEKEKKAGMVDANMARIGGDDVGALTALLSKFTRGGGVSKPFVCFRCAKI